MKIGDIICPMEGNTLKQLSEGIVNPSQQDFHAKWMLTNIVEFKDRGYFMEVIRELDKLVVMDTVVTGSFVVGYCGGELSGVATITPRTADNPAPLKSMTEVEHDWAYTLIQHSGFTIGRNPQFKEAVEEWTIPRAMAERVRKAGGLVFDTYVRARDAGYYYNYTQQQVLDLIPRAVGKFVPIALQQGVPIPVFVPKVLAP